MTNSARERATSTLLEICRGDRAAADRLTPVVYQQLRSLAAGYLRRQRPDHTLQPTALVHEAYLRLVDQTRTAEWDRAHFVALAATAMRQILVNHAVRRATAKRGGRRRRLTLDPALTPANRSDIDLLELDEALQRLARLDPRKAQVIEARFFGGLTNTEIAHLLNVSVSTIEGDWRMARAWLSAELREPENTR